MTRYLRFILPGLSLILLATGYYRLGLVKPSIGLLLFGLLWMLGIGFRISLASSLGLAVAFFAATAGLILDPASLVKTDLDLSHSFQLAVGSLNGSFVIFFLAALFAFLAWDVADFHSRLRLAASQDDQAGLERRHLARLATITLIGILLSSFTMLLRVRLTFEWMVVLLLISVWGISQLVHWLFKKSS